MPRFRAPVSTYRIQFNQNFRFVDGCDLVPYLNDLGITDLYSSPPFKAQRGSSHGYDIANPLRLNSELGTEQDFDEMAVKLQHYGMGLLLDTVPNHMAASSENPWWRDVLENGPASEYAVFFDINWHPTTSKAAFLQENKVLLPLLGDLYGKVLVNQELVLKVEDIGFLVRYYERKLPLNPKSSLLILEHSTARLRESLGDDHPAIVELLEILRELGRLPERTVSDPDQLAVRRRDKEPIKQRLWSAYVGMTEVRQAIDETLRIFSGTKGDARSFDALDQILSEQSYRLAFWKIGYEEINYRRFFDINELVGLRVEVPEVFDLRHRRVLELVQAGKATGLRIDHVDGLYDPLGYLERLQEAIGSPDGFYVLVEKILGRHESLPAGWPVHGTTGYDFLNAVNEIFIDPAGLEPIIEAYRSTAGPMLPFAEVCYASNKYVMEHLFPGEVNSLGHDLGQLAAQDREARDIPLSELMQILKEVTACLPIYRTYIRDFQISGRDRQFIERTLELARRRTPEDRVGPEAFAFMRRVLLLDPPYYAEEGRQAWLRFVMRWQQFSGPVMAKGLEDTAFYFESSLVSRNEVGGDPLREHPPRDVAAFHRFNLRRLEQWPHTMNATSTHDSKRSEDVRARINVLSELPREWNEYLDLWFRLNESNRRMVGGRPVPDPAQEILIYQTILGAWPLDEAELPDFAPRVKQFLVKAAREAKVNTSWIVPNEEHEAALQSFVDAILHEPGENQFLESLRPFQRRIAFFGALNSLAQVLAKIAAPGVPDFYQGCETWNFSLVDPDNRRPVNYRARQALLEELKRKAAEDRAALISDLVENWHLEGIKLYLTYTALEYRRACPDLFLRGGYEPLAASGPRQESVCSFARRLDGRWAVAVMPRWPVRARYRPPSLLSGDWGDTLLTLPEDAPAKWNNLLTGAAVEARPVADVRGLSLLDLLSDFPVALLEAAGN